MTPDTPVPVARPENEAADLWPICIHEGSCSFLAWDQTTRCNCRTNDIILAALATERRLTVERIEKGLATELEFHLSDVISGDPDWPVLARTILRPIFDEEANR